MNWKLQKRKAGLVRLLLARLGLWLVRKWEPKAPMDKPDERFEHVTIIYKDGKETVI